MLGQTRPMRCCTLPWESARGVAFAWRSVAPGMDSMKASFTRIVTNLRSITEESPTLETQDNEEKLEQERQYQSPAPKMNSVLTYIGVPKPLSTKMEEIVAASVMGHVLYPSLGNLISGFDTGAMSLAVMQLTSPVLIGSGWRPFSAMELGILVSSKLYGSFLGSIIAFDDNCSNLSSRDVLIYASYGLVIVSVATAVAPDRKWLLVARILSGLIEGSSSPARIAYTTETSSADLRYATIGARIGTFQLGAVVGAVWGAMLLPIPGSWHVMLGSTVVPALAMSLGTMTLPHSPQWLQWQGRKAEAALAVAWLRAAESPFQHSVGKIQDLQRQVELDRMCPIDFPDDPQKTQISSPTLSTFLRNPATWTTFWVIFFKQASGGVPIFYYKANVLTALGFGSHVGILTVIFIALRSLSTPAGTMLAGHLGYRDTLLLGSFGTSLSTLAMSVCPFSGLNLVLLAVNIVSFEMSFGTVSHQLAAELFLPQHRQRGVAWTHLCNYPLKGALLQAFPLAMAQTNTISFWSLLALVNAVGFLTIHALVPENCCADVLDEEFLERRLSDQLTQVHEESEPEREDDIDHA